MRTPLGRQWLKDMLEASAKNDLRARALQHAALHVDPTPVVPGAGHGLRSSPNAETTLPLDPELCLILTPEPAYGNARAGTTPEYVDELNLRSYAWAQQHIFGPSQQLVTAVRQRAKREKARLARLAPRPPSGIYSVKWPEGDEMKQDVRQWQASPRVVTPRRGGQRSTKRAHS
jgi:hypothetical protein